MKDKLNIVIVGGGSTWCPGILKALTKHMDILPLNRVMLYDIDAERQRPIGEFGKILFAEEEPGVEFGYTTDKDEAYTDVDFVLCQIRTGGYEMRSKDEKIPLHMGIIGQETVGPGGMAYGMRSMHDMLKSSTTFALIARRRGLSTTPTRLLLWHMVSSASCPMSIASSTSAISPSTSCALTVACSVAI